MALLGKIGEILGDVGRTYTLCETSPPNVFRERYIALAEHVPFQGSITVQCVEIIVTFTHDGVALSKKIQ